MRQILLKLGLPRKLYLDHGLAFRSHYLEEITASLGITLVHSPPYEPQGRGKIERSFRTVRSQFLPGFKSDILRDINEALECWIRGISTTSASNLAPDRPPCNASPARWSASGRTTPTWKSTSEKGPRAA
ncbi:hypothetical protein DFAR_710053 [Desulfarculales bacterium]